MYHGGQGKRTSDHEHLRIMGVMGEEEGRHFSLLFLESGGGGQHILPTVLHRVRVVSIQMNKLIKHHGAHGMIVSCTLSG